jgi:chromosome segregation ATPase
VGLNVSEAARRAGYKDPGESGWQLKKKWPEEIEAIEVKVREAKKLKDEELEEIPAEIARLSSASDQNRLKAVELLARMRGKLSDKVTINVTRSDLMKQLDEALATLAQLNHKEPAPESTLQDEMIRPIIGTPDKVKSPTSN